MYTSVARYDRAPVTWVVELADGRTALSDGPADVVVRTLSGSPYMAMSRVEAAQLRDALDAALDESAGA